MALLRILASLGLDTRGFDAGLRTAGRQVNQFGSDLKASIAGAFTTAAVTMWLKSVADATGRIKDLSEQTGLTTAEIQKADFALKQSGMTFEDLSGSLNKLTQSRRDAVEGNNELRESFARFGITLEQLNSPSLRNFDILMMVAGAMRDGAIAANEQGFVMDILGAKAGKLANILGTLAEAKPPSFFDDREIQKIDDATKAMERFSLSLKVATGEALGNWLDFWDLVTGKHRASEIKASFWVGPEEIAKASAEKKARMAARNAGEQEGLWQVDKAKLPAAQKEFDNLMSVVGMMFGAGKADPFSGMGKKTTTGGGFSGVESDQFQRIGAFTSGDKSSEATLGRMENELKEIRRTLNSTGAVIRGTA